MTRAELHELFMWAHRANPKPKDMSKAEHEAHMAETIRLMKRRIESERWEAEHRLNNE